MILPVQLKRLERDLEIHWDDGSIHRIPFRIIRNACPCATCREKASATSKPSSGNLPVLSAAEARPLVIEKMEPAGNYGYHIAFSDGHSSGLFPIELLWNLGIAS
ncbi:MAG: DUF971 domain-containing protein [Pirellulaceae bacterium]